VVRPTNDGQYELVAGERRLRAARLAGHTTIAAIVRETSDLMSAEMALLENLQREDLNPIEEATAYQRLGPGGFHLTQDEIAKRTGKDRSTIANVLRLLKLPEEVQALIEQDQLSFGHAKVLMAMPPSAAELITDMARRIVQRGLTVRQAEEAVTNLIQARPKAKKERIVDPNVREAEENLQRALGVRVAINDRNGKGKIVLEYKSLEDFDRIVEAVTGK
jgi:ParB family chromosome partitioning protein